LISVSVATVFHVSVLVLMYTDFIFFKAQKIIDSLYRFEIILLLGIRLKTNSNYLLTELLLPLTQ